MRRWLVIPSVAVHVGLVIALLFLGAWHLDKLEAGKVRFHNAGTHRRVYLKDLLEYKQQRDQDRHSALNRMALEAVEAGLYDKVLLPDE